MESDSEAGSQVAEKKDEGPPWWKVELNHFQFTYVPYMTI